MVAESVLVKQQLLILNRSRYRSPNLLVCDRVVAGLCTLLMRPGRLIRSAIVLKPSTLLSLKSSAEEPQVPATVLAQTAEEAGPKRTWPGSHCSGCPDEATESNVGLSAYRPTNRFSLRYSNQQGCGSADSRCSLPTRARLGWSFMAHFPRSHEGQPLEPRPLSMRIRNLANTLGSCRDGPIHAAHRWVWSSRRHRGWSGAMPECSIERFAGKVCPNTSARIMIRCIGSTNGKPICALTRIVYGGNLIDVEIAKRM